MKKRKRGESVFGVLHPTSKVNNDSFPIITSSSGGCKSLRCIKRNLLVSAAAAIVVLAGVFIAVSTAQSAAARCTAPFWYWGVRQCTTASIPANPTYHYVQVSYYLCKGARWKVWDTETGVTVGSGTSPGRSWRKHYIYGLYGRSYKAKIWDTCASDVIEIRNEQIVPGR